MENNGEQEIGKQKVLESWQKEKDVFSDHKKTQVERQTKNVLQIAENIIGQVNGLEKYGIAGDLGKETYTLLVGREILEIVELTQLERTGKYRETAELGLLRSARVKKTKPFKDSDILLDDIQKELSINSMAGEWSQAPGDDTDKTVYKKALGYAAKATVDTVFDQLAEMDTKNSSPRGRFDFLRRSPSAKDTFIESIIKGISSDPDAQNYTPYNGAFNPLELSPSNMEREKIEGYQALVTEDQAA